jgi:flagellin
MRVQIRSLASAERSANDGIAMAQVADDALHRLGGLLEQMRAVASQGTSGKNSDGGHEKSALEFSHLQAQVAGIQKGATYDGRPLLGEEAVEVGFDVGWESGASDRMALTLGGLAPLTPLALDAQSGGQATGSVVSRIDDALMSVADKRARFAAAVNRFTSTTAAVQVARTSRAAGSSPLANAAKAEELAQLAKAQILGQGLGATLMQANQLPAQAMSLLQD